MIRGDMIKGDMIMGDMFIVHGNKITKTTFFTELR